MKEEEERRKNYSCIWQYIVNQTDDQHHINYSMNNILSMQESLQIILVQNSPDYPTSIGHMCWSTDCSRRVCHQLDSVSGIIVRNSRRPVGSPDLECFYGAVGVNGVIDERDDPPDPQKGEAFTVLLGLMKEVEHEMSPRLFHLKDILFSLVVRANDSPKAWKKLLRGR